MRHYIDLVESLGLGGQFFHGTSSGKPRSTTGLYVTNHEGWARVYAQTAAEVYGGEPLVLAGRVKARHPKLVDADDIEGIAYNDDAIAGFIEQGYDSAMRADGQEVFLFSHGDFVVAD